MAGGITVTPEQLQEISSQLSRGAEEIQNILSQLANNVAPLHTDWVGAAHARFEELWEQWQKDGTGLHAALEGVSKLTTQAAHAYEQTEQDIAQSFNT